jgi:hypothetical protein
MKEISDLFLLISEAFWIAAQCSIKRNDLFRERLKGDTVIMKDFIFVNGYHSNFKRNSVGKYYFQLGLNRDMD